MLLWDSGQKFNSEDIPGFIGKSFVGALIRKSLEVYATGEESVENFLESEEGCCCSSKSCNFSTNFVF